MLITLRTGLSPILSKRMKYICIFRNFRLICNLSLPLLNYDGVYGR